MACIAGGDRRLAQDLDGCSGLSFGNMSRVQADPSHRYGSGIDLGPFPITAKVGLPFHNHYTPSPNIMSNNMHL